MARKWNWQSPQWPDFAYDPELLESLERDFIHRSGVLKGSVKHIAKQDQITLSIELMSDEALKTSEIEGHYFNRDSLQSCIRKHLGFETSNSHATAEEIGISELMVELYQNFDVTLTHESLFDWHQMICSGRRDLDVVGGYRTHTDPMQIVSSRLDSPKVFFEAPPSAQVHSEMNQFVTWYESTGPHERNALPPLARAGVTHFYFLCIHPFEDGNGRIARALSEKTLSQHVGQPCLISLSKTINSKKKDYYANLQAHNYTCEITDWLVYFANSVLESLGWTIEHVEFLISKARFYDRFQSAMNDRQQKVIKRVFEVGPAGFEGGLSAKNYISITKTSSSSATRDLQDLVSKRILTMTGERKSARYWLCLVA